jgi:hypothetical protein
VPGGGEDNLAHRFRDMGRASTLRYSLRALRKFAPWLRKVWIVVHEAQRPTWMDHALAREHGLEFVSHAQVFDDPAAQLSTFNSCAIEAHLHKIAGLAECYLYLNDNFVLDTVAGAGAGPGVPLKPKAWFTGERVPRVGRDPWQEKIANLGKMMHRDLGLR